MMKRDFISLHLKDYLRKFVLQIQSEQQQCMFAMCCSYEHFCRSFRQVALLRTLPMIFGRPWLQKKSVPFSTLGNSHDEPRKNVARAFCAPLYVNLHVDNRPRFANFASLFKQNMSDR